MTDVELGAVIALVFTLVVVIAVGAAVLLVDRLDARRHGRLELQLENMRRLVLAAIDGRSRIEATVEDLKEVASDHATLLGPAARRPKIRPG